MEKELVASVISELEQLPGDIRDSIKEGVRLYTNGEQGWLQGYLEGLIDGSVIDRRSCIARLPIDFQKCPAMIYRLAACLVLDHDGAAREKPSIQECMDFGEANHLWLRMEGGLMLGSIAENEQFGCVPLFKTSDGKWHFSDGPYGVIETFYQRHGYGLTEDDEVEAEEKGLSDHLVDRFSELILEAASRLANLDIGASEDLDVRVEDIHYRIKVTSVVCDRFGNEAGDDI